MDGLVGFGWNLLRLKKRLETVEDILYMDEVIFNQ